MDIRDHIEIDSFYQGFSEPESGSDKKVIETPFCPLCLTGENRKDIKICDDCQDVFEPVNRTWDKYWEVEKRMRRLKKVEIEVKERIN
jgi:hypothetical protein